MPSTGLGEKKADVALRAVSVGTVGWAGVGFGDLRGLFQPKWFCDATNSF